jgi:hypothetical protein
MPSTDRKLELKAKTSMAQTVSQAAVYVKGLRHKLTVKVKLYQVGYVIVIRNDKRSAKYQIGKFKQLQIRRTNNILISKQCSKIYYKGVKKY